MSRSPLISLALGIVVSLGACGPSKTQKQQINIWLLCEDCPAGDRQRVAAIGKKAVQILWAALRDGPPIEGRRNTEAQVRDLYRRLGSVAATEASFVNEYLSNYVNGYRIRAAISLGDIQVGGAKEALAEAIKADSTAPLPAPVRIAVYNAAAGQYQTFSGSLSDSSVAAFDTVLLRRGIKPWNGAERISIPGSPFPDSVVVSRNADTIRFLAVGTPGEYNLLVNEGGTAVRVPLRITTLQYEAHAPNLSFSPPTPWHEFIALGAPPARDTIEYFRFAAPPGNIRTVTATADWQSGANVDLSWQVCDTPTVVGNADGVTNGKPEKTTVTVPGGQCWKLLVVIHGPSAAEIIKLDFTPP